MTSPAESLMRQIVALVEQSGAGLPDILAALQYVIKYYRGMAN